MREQKQVSPVLEHGRNITVLMAMTLGLVSVYELTAMGLDTIGTWGFAIAVLVPLLFVGWNWDRLNLPLVLLVCWFSLGNFINFLTYTSD